MKGERDYATIVNRRVTWLEHALNTTTEEAVSKKCVKEATRVAAEVEAEVKNKNRTRTTEGNKKEKVV